MMVLIYTSCQKSNKTRVKYGSMYIQYTALLVSFIFAAIARPES